MTDHEERWAEVGAAIAARMEQLKLTKAEILRASKISDKTFNGYLAGRPIRRTDKARGLCEALGWRVDAIDRILEGLPPIDQAAVDAAFNDKMWAELRLEELRDISPEDLSEDDEARIEHWEGRLRGAERQLDALQGPTNRDRDKRLRIKLTGKWYELQAVVDQIEPIELRLELVDDFKSIAEARIAADLALAAEGEPPPDDPRSLPSEHGPSAEPNE